MTPIGHSLVGLTCAVLSAPAGLPRRGRVALGLGFVLLASLPDLPLPGWGHDRYRVSHSVVVNGLLMAGLLALLAVWRQGRRRLGGWRVLAGGTLAWSSHFVLDALYRHGRGVALFWPLGGGRLALPLPWFDTVAGVPPPLDAHTLRVAAVELLCYAPLLLLALAWRRWRRPPPW